MGNELADRWMQQIPQMEGQIEKTDMVICEQVNDELSGTIQRLLPESERFKRWNFSAKCMSELVLGTFWPRDESKNPGSYGMILLNLIHKNSLEGFWIELGCDEQGGRFKFTGACKMVPSTWHRNP